MTNFEFEESQTRIFSWSLADDWESKSVSTESGWRTWMSDEEFRLKNNKDRGRLELENLGSSWDVILRIDRSSRMAANYIYKSYFLCKYTFKFDAENTAAVSEFAPHVATGDKIVLISWEHTLGPSTTIRSVLLEMYQIPAAIPRYLPYANCSVTVGKIPYPKPGSPFPKMEPRFDFGAADHQVVVRFLFDGVTSDGLRVILRAAIKDGASLALKFTVFGGESKAKDIVRVRSKAPGSILIASYDELGPLAENGTLYYKAVLQVNP